MMIAALFSLFFFSCDAALTSSTTAHSLQLTTDALPAALVRNIPFIDRFVLTWFDERFRYQQRVIPSDVLFGSEGGAHLLSISIARNTPTPITLTPIASNGARFSPAGTVAPLRGLAGSGARHHHAVLRWEEGCAVIPLVRAFPITDGLHGFNVNRYLALATQQSVEERCWMDSDAIIELLRQGTMRSSAIRSRPLHQARLLLPKGRWLSENIFQSPIVSDGITATVLPPLPYGIFHLFDSEQRAYLRISLTIRYTIVVYRIG